MQIIKICLSIFSIFNSRKMKANNANLKDGDPEHTVQGQTRVKTKRRALTSMRSMYRYIEHLQIDFRSLVTVG